MYSSVKHDRDNRTPKPWEHKDTMSCFWPEPVFFFVEVDNHSPVYGQSIQFTFTFLDMYGDDKGKDYLIDVYLDDELIETDVDPLDVYKFSTKGVDDTYPLVFKFIAKPLDTRYEVLESDEIIITVKGCNTADWYVAVDGNDNNAGTKDNPFKTLPKALSMVEGSKNVVVLKNGTFPINSMQTIDTPTSIISCQGAVIRDDNHYDFFNILQDCSLYLMGITLKHKCCEMYGVDHSFVNKNLTQNPVYLRINPELMCKPPVDVRIDDVMTEIYAHSSFTVEGTLINAKEDVPIPDEEIQLITGDTVVDTDTTDSNGEYDFIHELDSLGIHYFKLYHEESLKYCMGESLFNVTVSAMPTTLTCTMDSEVLLDDELIIPKTTELILKDAEILFGPKGRLTISGNQVVIERCVFSVKAECTRSDFDEFVLGLDLNNLVFKMCEFNGNMIRSSIGNNGGNITIENSRFVEMKNMKCPGIVYARRSSSSISVFDEILGMNSSGSVICMDSSFVRCSCVKNDGIIPVMLCAAADMRVEKSVFIDCQVCSAFFYYCGYNNKFIADKLKFVNSFSSNLLVDAERSKSCVTFSFGLHCFKATKFNNVTCVWRYLGTYHLDEKNYPEDEFDKLLSGESGKE